MNLWWSSLALGCLLVACSSDDEPGNEPSLPGPPAWNVPVNEPPDDQAETTRLACGYQAGDMPAATQGVSRPNGAEIPIDTIVVAMMENRSFDHYFQKIGDIGIAADVAPDGFSNPDTEGNPVQPFRDQVYCFVDTPHGAGSIRQQINSGAMDGFVVEASGTHESPLTGELELLDGKRAMGYYTKDDLPLHYWIAENFAIGDRYFSSAPTATWPNRMYLFAATSFGQANNDFPENVEKTLFDYLDERQIDWKFYTSGTATLGIILSKFLEYQDQGHIAPISQFHSDAAAGTLPKVAFVDPDGTSSPDIHHSDEHPPALMEIGQNWLGEVVSSLTKSKYWPRSALFITYDEHGGLYDHVVPPPACPPDDRFENPLVKYDQYGVRVPFLVVSPFAKKGYVSHRTYDHTSIVRFIEARFVMPALTARDANAEAPWDAFDFESPPSVEVPAVPIPQVDPVKLAACNAMWGL